MMMMMMMMIMMTSWLMHGVLQTAGQRSFHWPAGKASLIIIIIVLTTIIIIIMIIPIRRSACPEKLGNVMHTTPLASR